MQYTVIFNRKSYDLPKKTMAIWEDLDSIFKLDATNLPNREKYKKMIEFIAKLQSLSKLMDTASKVKK